MLTGYDYISLLAKRENGLAKTVLFQKLQTFNYNCIKKKPDIHT